MKGLLLRSMLLACLSLAGFACGGDDDDDGAGSACAHAQQVCKDNTMMVEIDCADLEGVPASISDCVSKAATCDAVGACFLNGSAGGG